MNKKIRLILIDQADSEFKNLNRIVGQQIKNNIENSPEIQLLNSIKSKAEILKANPFYGNNIEKKKIPKKLNVSNLWRVELSNYWRMLYTIKGDEIEVVCFILNIINHNDYNKILGYKKK